MEVLIAIACSLACHPTFPSPCLADGAGASKPRKRREPCCLWRIAPQQVHSMERGMALTRQARAPYGATGSRHRAQKEKTDRCS